MSKSINKVIKVLIISDVALVTGYGFMDPIFAIFISERIAVAGVGGAAMVAGFAMAIYWGVKSLIQIPLARYLDGKKGEKDDFYFVVFGNLLAAVSIFGYLVSSQPWHVYLLKGIFSIGMAMNIPAWTAIFTRHIDKGREAFEWATRSTSIGIGAGISGAVGGIIASIFGFNLLFIGVGLFIAASAFLPFLIYKEFSPLKNNLSRVPESKDLQGPHLPKE